MSQPTQKHIDFRDVRYLALEGGGGKGFAYLGALELLEEKGVMANIQGVSGASAGAITALMISMGMSASEISDEISSGAFGTFFDVPNPRLIPQPGPDPYQKRQDTIEETQNLRKYGDPSALRKLANDLQNSANKIGPGHLPGWIVWTGVAPVLRAVGGIEELEDKFVGNLLKPPFSNLVKHWEQYFAYLDRDMGFFSGQAARQYFDDLIVTQAQAATRDDSPSFRSMTFELHKQIFKRDLVVCGANFSTGKTVLFSARQEHTPKFPVADAIRISMSLPFVFKPYVIRKDLDGYPPCGTYVDGGFWNNIPLREIEPIPAAITSSTDPGSQQWPAKTLALRLDVDTPSKVLTALDVASTMMMGIKGAGESQVLKELDWLSVMLDTSGLSMLNFQPSPDMVETVRKRSRRAICRYFNWPIDQSDIDVQDDKNTAKLFAMTACDL